jgi:hypothetical protein
MYFIPLYVQFHPLKFVFPFFHDVIFMKKLENIDFGTFYNAIYWFSKIMYSLRDTGKINFLSRVTPLSPSNWSMI